MMCLVFRFKACTVCKTVGAWTPTLFSAQIKKCQLKVEARWVCDFSLCLSFSLSSPFLLSISLNHNDLFKQQHVGSQDDRIIKILR